MAANFITVDHSTGVSMFDKGISSDVAFYAKEVTGAPSTISGYGALWRTSANGLMTSSAGGSIISLSETSTGLTRVDGKLAVDGSTIGAAINDNTVSLAKLSNASAGQVIVANESGVLSAVSMAGNVKVTTSGYMNIQTSAITNSMIAGDAAIDYSKINVPSGAISWSSVNVGTGDIAWSEVSKNSNDIVSTISSGDLSLNKLTSGTAAGQLIVADANGTPQWATSLTTGLSLASGVLISVNSATTSFTSTSLVPKSYVDQALQDASIPVYATVTGLSAATGHVDNDIAYVADKETFYRYEATGASYTVDSLYVADTTETGDTRWVAISGRYIHGGSLNNFIAGTGAMLNNVDSYDNVAVGRNSGKAITTGSRWNVAMGLGALESATSGTNDNVAIGEGAGRKIDGGTENGGGDDNIAIGDYAGSGIVAGSNNIALGSSSMGNASANNINYNIAIGLNAGYNLDTSETIAIGRDAAGQTTTGEKNTAVGSFSLANNQIGKENVAVGYDSLKNSRADRNVGVGTNALKENLGGSDNIGIGFDAGSNLTTGINNIAIGTSATFSSATGSNQLVIGNFIKGNMVSGGTLQYVNSPTISNSKDLVDKAYVDNNALPKFAAVVNLSASTGHVDNDIAYVAGTESFYRYEANGTAYTVDGVYTADTADGGDTRWIAIAGKYTNSTMSPAGIDAQGTIALVANTTGQQNAGFGYGALSANTYGSYNAAFGSGALYQNVTGDWNAAVGVGALQNSKTSWNAALGGYALNANTTGIDNTAVGGGALAFNTFGHSNVGVGKQALYANTTGQRNVAVGSGALAANIRGVGNIAIGYQAGDNLTSGLNNIIIGNDIHFNSASGDNQLNIGGWLKGNMVSSGTLQYANAPTITADNDIVNKAYVDAIAQGLSVHGPSYAATTSKLAAYSISTSGLTLTSVGTTAFGNLDDVALTFNSSEALASRVLIKNEVGVHGNGAAVPADWSGTNVTFTVAVPGVNSGNPVVVTLTGNNSTRDNVITDINSAFAAASPALNTYVSAYAVESDRIGIRALGAVTSFILQDTGDSVLTTNIKVPAGYLGINITGSPVNGIYYAKQDGGSGNPWIFYRATDFDGTPAGEIADGDFTFIANGTVNGHGGFVQAIPWTSGTLNVTMVQFVQFSGAGQLTAGDGLTLVGNQIELVASGADKYLYSDGVNSWLQGDITSFGRSLLDDVSATNARTTLGLGSLAVQTSGAVSISGGDINGLTTLGATSGSLGFLVVDNLQLNTNTMESTTGHLNLTAATSSNAYINVAGGGAIYLNGGTDGDIDLTGKNLTFNSLNGGMEIDNLGAIDFNPGTDKNVTVNSIGTGIFDVKSGTIQQYASAVAKSMQMVKAITTSGATTANLDFAVPTTGMCGYVAYVTGTDNTTGAQSFIQFRGAVSNYSGTAAHLGYAVKDIFASAGTGIDTDVDVASGNLRLTVSGVTGKDIKWTGQVEFVYANGAA